MTAFNYAMSGTALGKSRPGTSRARSHPHLSKPLFTFLAGNRPKNDWN